MKRFLGLVVAVCMVIVMAGATVASAQSTDEQRFSAMWLSIAHPGLGEWYLKGWGSFRKCPQKKFWLGLIPVFGWPGYLQVKSAIDARHGRTNDELGFEE